MLTTLDQMERARPVRESLKRLPNSLTKNILR